MGGSGGDGGNSSAKANDEAKIMEILGIIQSEAPDAVKPGMLSFMGCFQMDPEMHGDRDQDLERYRLYEPAGPLAKSTSLREGALKAAKKMGLLSAERGYTGNNL